MLPDTILSQVEVGSEDEEPAKKKPKVDMAGPMYSNCHVIINYVGQK